MEKKISYNAQKNCLRLNEFMVEDTNEDDLKEE